MILRNRGRFLYKIVVRNILSQTGSGAHPVSYLMGTGGSFLGVKRPWRKADHSPPSSAEVKNAWGYTYITPVRLHGVVCK